MTAIAQAPPTVPLGISWSLTAMYLDLPFPSATYRNYRKLPKYIMKLRRQSKLTSSNNISEWRCWWQLWVVRCALDCKDKHENRSQSAAKLESNAVPGAQEIRVAWARRCSSTRRAGALLSETLTWVNHQNSSGWRALQISPCTVRKYPPQSKTIPPQQKMIPTLN